MRHQSLSVDGSQQGEQKSNVSDEKRVNLTLLGDSTIDNRVWVDGLFKSYFYTRLGIKRDPAPERVRKAHRIIRKPDLSVVENVMYLLPDYVIHDLTNDGFTTEDVLQGAVRDKVFGRGRGTFSIFPNQLFRPLEDGEESIKNSQHIVVSVGGNNFREALQEAGRYTGQARTDFVRHKFDPKTPCKLHVRSEFPIDLEPYHNSYLLVRNILYYVNHRGRARDHFAMVTDAEASFRKLLSDITHDSTRDVDKTLELTNEQEEQLITSRFGYSRLTLKHMAYQYIEILTKIRRMNPHARITLMTQYYPSASQNNYKIYPFMKEIGEILNLGGMFHNPMTVIHEIMKMTYADVLKKIPHENIVVADITSSLNPFDDKNHVSQIEPSGLGGKKIARMLKYVMTSDKVVPGHAYRFYPEFFTSNEQDQHVEGSDFDHWVPAHPWDLREGYSFEEEKVFRKYNADQLDPATLLQRLETAMEQHDKTSPMYKAAVFVRNEAENLSHELPEGDIKKWKMSVVLALNVLETPKNSPEYPNAVRLLRANADHRAIGKSDGWKKFKAALSMLEGAAVIGLSIAGVPFTSGASLAGFYVAGSLLAVGGAAFFYRNRQKSLAKQSASLAKAASRQLTV